jgi:hypothetical protein
VSSGSTWNMRCSWAMKTSGRSRFTSRLALRGSGGTCRSATVSATRQTSDRASTAEVCFSPRVAASRRVDAGVVESIAPLPEFLDLDLAAVAEAARRGISPPEGSEERLDLHLAHLEHLAGIQRPGIRWWSCRAVPPVPCGPVRAAASSGEAHSRGKVTQWRP